MKKITWNIILCAKELPILDNKYSKNLIQYSGASEFVTVAESCRIVPYNTVPFFVFVYREYGPDLKHNLTKNYSF